MALDIAAQVIEVVKAANDLNEVRAGELADELVAMFPRYACKDIQLEAMRAFKALRRKRMFAHLQRALEGYLLHCGAPSIVQTLYAQALIDQNQLASALGLLSELSRSAKPDSAEAEEARGLLGRIYKQAFVHPYPGLPRGADALHLAVEAYSNAHALAVRDPCWPGVNLLALVVRAREQGIKLRAEISEADLAARLLACIKGKEAEEYALAEERGREPRDPAWLMATALETHLALESYPDVMRYADRFLTAPDTDAFELGSTVRQLKEVWRLHAGQRPFMPQLLGVLEAELLKKSGGMLSDPVRVTGHELQAIYGADRFQTWRWFSNGLRAADGVGRVEDVNGRAFGTGFLVRGRDLKREWGDRQVFVTNRHVIDDPAPRDGVAPGRAVVSFTTHEGSKPIRVTEILWSSPPEPGLDVAVVALASDVKPEYVLDLDSTGVVEPRNDTTRIYVIGHPQGEALSYSLYTNELVGLEAPFLYYRSPTTRGSSGSPLFNHDWSVIGIHHHGSNPTWNANGGSLMTAVCASL